MIDTNKLRTQELRNTRSLDPIVKLLHNLVRNDLVDLANIINGIDGIVSPSEAIINITSGNKISITYINLSGVNFIAGETITDNVTTATGVVVSNDIQNGVLVIDSMTGFFRDGDEIEGADSNTADISGDVETADGATVILYDNLAVDVFLFDETITDAVTGSTAVVVSDNGTDTLIVKNVNSSFGDNNEIEGATSGATADVNGDPFYSPIDLSGIGNARVVFLASDNTVEAIESFINAPSSFRVIAKNNTISIYNGTIKTSTGQPIVLNGNNGDWASFEERDEVVKQTGVMVYANS